MENILLGFQQLADPVVLLTLFLGVLLGLTVGALPGLNDSITIAVLIPVTFGMQPTLAFALLVGIYCSSACGGSISPQAAASSRTQTDNHKAATFFFK